MIIDTANRIGISIVTTRPLFLRRERKIVFGYRIFAAMHQATTSGPCLGVTTTAPTIFID